MNLNNVLCLIVISNKLFDTYWHTIGDEIWFDVYKKIKEPIIGTIEWRWKLEGNEMNMQTRIK